MPTKTLIDPALLNRLRMVVTRLSRRLRQQIEPDVTASQFSALVSIERLGPVSLGQLAAVERVQPPTLTKVVTKLEEFGYVTREPDPADRRIARVRLSEAGGRFVDASRTRRNQYLAERLKQFSAAELADLERALPLFERLADDVEGQP
jgi:DNA-binding MarR family transcriptional regulator